jgi:hypothetical protein
MSKYHQSPQDRFDSRTSISSPTEVVNLCDSIIAGDIDSVREILNETPSLISSELKLTDYLGVEYQNKIEHRNIGLVHIAMTNIEEYETLKNMLVLLKNKGVDITDNNLDFARRYKEEISPLLENAKLGENLIAMRNPEIPRLGNLNTTPPPIARFPKDLVKLLSKTLEKGPRE